MKTIALDSNWDIGVDSLGNLATLENNDRLAQDVASSVRVFKGELPFDIERGVNYDKPDENRETLNYEMNEQARLVEGVADSVVVFEELKDRTLKPVVYVTNEDGQQIGIGE